MTDPTVSAIRDWILPYFTGVDLDDMLTASRDSIGSDDVPHLSLQEQTYTPAFERVYGAWGCSREVTWEICRPGAPFDPERAAQHAANFVGAFVRRNGRVKLVLRGTVANGLPRRELVVERIADVAPLGACQ